MSKIKYFLLKNQNILFLLIFCLAVLIGDYASQAIQHLLIESDFNGGRFAPYVGLTFNILIILLIVYFAVKSADKFKKNAADKMSSEIDVGFPKFLESVGLLDEVKELAFFVDDYSHMYRFLHLDFYVELRLTKIKTFEVYWYKNDTREFISSRTIYYRNEPTIQSALGNGPYYSIKLDFWHDSKSK